MMAENQHVAERDEVSAFVNGGDRLQTDPQRVVPQMPGALASGRNGVQEGGTGVTPLALSTISSPKDEDGIWGIWKKSAADFVTGSGTMPVRIYASSGARGRPSALTFLMTLALMMVRLVSAGACHVSEIPTRRTKGCPSAGKASQPGGEDLLERAVRSEAGCSIGHRAIQEVDQRKALPGHGGARRESPGRSRVSEVITWSGRGGSVLEEFTEVPRTDPQALSGPSVAALHGQIKGCPVGRETDPPRSSTRG